MPSICVRVSLEDKVVIPWSFIDTPAIEYTYETVLSDIISGKFSHIEMKNTKFKCKNVKVIYGLCSTNHKLTEQVRGQPSTDIVSTAQNFSMLYFTLVIQHDDECLQCKEDQINIAPTRIFFPSTNSDQLSGRGPTKKKLSRTLTLIHPHPRPVENDHP